MAKIINNFKTPFNRLNEDIQAIHTERAQSNNNKKLKNMSREEALKEFESLFVFYMLKEMNKSGNNKGLFGKGFGNEYFSDMFNQEISRSLSKSGGIGIADFIEKAAETKVIKGKNGFKDFSLSTPLFPKKKETAKSIHQIVNKGIVSSHFGIRTDPLTGDRRFHDGIDIACREGTKVYPFLPGKVVFSGEKRGYGNVVIIEHNNGMKSYYAHNKINFAKEGDVIDGSFPIALSGNTGRSTGPHLHFEIRAGDKPQNPEKYIKT